METKTIAEYKTPRCKVLKVHVQNLICTSPGADGYGAKGHSGKDTDITDLGDDF